MNDDQDDQVDQHLRAIRRHTPTDRVAAMVAEMDAEVAARDTADVDEQDHEDYVLDGELAAIAGSSDAGRGGHETPNIDSVGHHLAQIRRNQPS